MNRLSGVLRLAHRAHAALILSLAASAPALMLLCRHAPSALPVFWRFPAAAVALTVLCLSLSSWRRLLAVFLSASALAALGYASLPLWETPGLALLPLGALLVLLAALPLAAQQAGEMHPAVYSSGLFLQLSAHAIAHLSGRMPRPQYTAVIPAMTLVFIAYLFLCLLTMNAASLRNSTMGRHRAPVSIRRFNTLLVAAFMALSLAFAAIPAVARGVVRLWGMIVSGAAWLARMIASLLPEAAPMGLTGAGGAGGMPLIPYEAAEPSLLAIILERIAALLALLLFAALVFAGLRIILRRLRDLAAALLDRLQRYVAAASSEDDEITDTREEGAERRQFLPRLLRRRAEHDPKTPSGRIRLAYARLLRRHEDWADSSTARENMPQDAAAIYEQARYSAHPVTDEDAERFISGSKKL